MSEEEKTEQPQSTEGGPPGEKVPEQIAAPETEEQPQTSNLSSEASAKEDLEHQTENMEVHKHPHHVTHKKKWGEYLLEFLMLFLAVFLGFLAENIREHVVEQSRAKEFSRSLVQDLQNDTAAMNIQKMSAGLYIAVADSLLKLSKTQLEGRNAAQFSFYTRFTYWTVPISWNRNTFEQIKNSGSLRYFQNDRLLKKLLEYDAAINDINSEADQNKLRGNMLLTYINSTIDPELHHELSKHLIAALDTMSVETKESFFSYKTASLENKREKITEMLNMIVVQQRNFRNQISNRLKPAQVLATELISDLKKEYHLE
jgi:hypothetical protein